MRGSGCQSQNFSKQNPKYENREHPESGLVQSNRPVYQLVVVRFFCRADHVELEVVYIIVIARQAFGRISNHNNNNTVYGNGKKFVLIEHAR